VSRLEIPFVDLGASVRALRSEIDAAIARVLDSGWFVLGPENEAFEAELAAAFGVGDSVAVANGTEALQLALETLGIGPGDEVVTTPISAAFTALAIERAGARPVFADVEPDTLNLSPEAAERAITGRTRALLPVHLYGHPANLAALGELAGERGLHLVEDACQAHGARFGERPVGGFGVLAALSFYPTKNLGGLGDGGAVLVGDPERALKLRRLRNGGQSDRYRHVESGINSRLDELQAAVLRVKLRHLEEWTERRRALAALYRQELADACVSLPVERPGVRAACHLFVIRHPRRDELARELRERGVGTLIHYPIPLHLQPAFARLGGQPGSMPVAERAAGEILSLPLQPELDEASVRAVAAAVRECASRLA
jgi:dTDP-3-amino-3,4,6-trideoxy-alpha-D-glucose transaminase